jgi:hypothetical protein
LPDGSISRMSGEKKLRSGGLVNKAG